MFIVRDSTISKEKLKKLNSKQKNLAQCILQLFYENIDVESCTSFLVFCPPPFDDSRKEVFAGGGLGGWEDRRDIFLCQVRRRRRTEGYGIGIDRVWDSCCSACLVTFVRSIGGKKDIVRTQIHPLSTSLEKYGLDRGGRVERDQPTVS